MSTEETTADKTARNRAKTARAKARLAERQAAAHESMAHLPVMPQGFVVLEVKYHKTPADPWCDDTRIAVSKGWAALYRPRAKSHTRPVWAMPRCHMAELQKLSREEAKRQADERRRKAEEDRKREIEEYQARFTAYWSDPVNATRWTDFRPMMQHRDIGCRQVQMLQCLVDMGGEANVATLAKSMDCTRRLDSQYGFYLVKSIGMSLCRRRMIEPVGVTADAPYPLGFAITDEGRAALNESES